MNRAADKITRFSFCDEGIEGKEHTTQAQEKWDVIEHNFTTHPLNQQQQERFLQVQHEAKRLAHLIVALTVESREQAISITGLEEVVDWTKKAIEREVQG